MLAVVFLVFFSKILMVKCDRFSFIDWLKVRVMDTRARLAADEEILQTLEENIAFDKIPRSDENSWETYEYPASSVLAEPDNYNYVKYQDSANMSPIQEQKTKRGSFAGWNSMGMGGPLPIQARFASFPKKEESPVQLSARTFGAMRMRYGR